MHDGVVEEQTFEGTSNLRTELNKEVVASSFEKDFQEMQEMLQQLKLEKEKTEVLLKEKDEMLKAKDDEIEMKGKEQEKMKTELKKLQKLKEFKPTMTLPFIQVLNEKEQDKKRKKGGNEIKRPCPPYSLWCKDQWNEVKKENPDAEFKDISHILGAKWKTITAEEKKPYEEKYQVEKEAYLKTWNQDSGYLFGSTGNLPYLPGVKIKYTAETPAYSAPVMVYSTMRSMGPEPNVSKNYNLTWLFPVDAGFHYLLRLHFCETRQEVKTVNDLVFLIYINNQTAQHDADVIHMSGGNGIPVYKDYIVPVPQGSQSKQDLWLALHPNMELKPSYADAILNGLEIFKLNTTDGNLAGLNPEPTVAPPPAEQNPSLQERRAGKRSSILHVIGIVGGSIGAVIACSLIVYFFAFKQERVKDTSKSDQEKSSWTLLSKTSSVDGINMEEKSSFSPHRGVMASDEDDMFSGAESCSRSTFSTDAASVTLSDPVQRARSEGVFSEIIEPKGR
ncbi:hypothetical protein DKX38_030160 [Salix brachista]|uniref:HMG box domain-containing protein n=1 Tax=Salix brachista TaxID=2182728 RepID=A0A5N5IZM1_9ROSI|nr:hypothetical protein DKX38_030160 [Salix brachista]